MKILLLILVFIFSSCSTTNVDPKEAIIQVRKNNIEYVSRIIENTKFTDQNPDFLNTALFNAVGHNYIEMSKLLLKKGADVNHEGFNNNRVIHIAVEYNNIKMIELLLN